MNSQAPGGVGRRSLLQALPATALLAAIPLKAQSAPTAAAAGAFDRRTWWKHEYRVLQTNLREVDVRHDPGEIARATRAFGANVLVSNIGGIVAFYPTALELHHRNPYRLHRPLRPLEGAEASVRRTSGMVHAQSRR
jgi:hypothetical protein